MKKIILIALFFIVVLVGIGMLKYRTNGTFVADDLSGGDLVVVNDTKETFSTAFTRNGKMMSQVIHPNEKATGGRGLLRIFVADKRGNYELQYAYPRPAGQTAEISLTQVLQAAQGPVEVGRELYTEKGRIGDIRVDYEEVRELQVTY